MPAGRPSEYSQEVAAAICGRLADGEPLTKICKDEAMPVTSTVYKWMMQNPEFASAYARAREEQADTYADDIVSIADDARNDTQVDDDGNTIVDFDHIQRAKLRVDARKWVAAKLKPKKWGDKVAHEHSGAVTLEGLVANANGSDSE
jgi:hypothetical protein